MDLKSFSVESEYSILIITNEAEFVKLRQAVSALFWDYIKSVARQPLHLFCCLAYSVGVIPVCLISKVIFWSLTCVTVLGSSDKTIAFLFGVMGDYFLCSIKKKMVPLMCSPFR